MSTPSNGDVRTAAQQLIETQMQARLDIVEKLADGQATEQELARQLTEIQQTYTRNWAEAERLGWNRRDLKKLKLDPPKRQPPGRPTRTRKTPAEAHESPDGVPVPGSDNRHSAISPADGS